MSINRTTVSPLQPVQETVALSRARGNAFVIAGPERALGDTACLRRLTWEGIGGLCARLRVDMNVLADLDLELLDQLTGGYRSPSVRELLSRLSQALGGGS